MPRLRVSCGRSRRAIIGLGLVWIGLQSGGEASDGANGKQEMSMNEGIFARIWPLSGRIMIAAVQERKGWAWPSEEKARREGGNASNADTFFFSRGGSYGILGSRYNFSFSPSGSSHFPQFRRVIYHLDNGSDFYLLNSTSRFLALPSISLTSHVAVPRFSYVCRVSNDAYRMDWKAMVGSIIDRSRHEEFKQPGCVEGDRERWATMGMGDGRGWRGDRWRGKRSGRTLLKLL